MREAGGSLDKELSEEWLKANRDLMPARDAVLLHKR